MSNGVLNFEASKIRIVSVAKNFLSIFSAWNCQSLHNVFLFLTFKEFKELN